MKQNYQAPIIKTLLFENVDVITTSDGDPNTDNIGYWDSNWFSQPGATD